MRVILLFSRGSDQGNLGGGMLGFHTGNRCVAGRDLGMLGPQTSTFQVFSEHLLRWAALAVLTSSLSLVLPLPARVWAHLLYLFPIPTFPQLEGLLGSLQRGLTCGQSETNQRGVIIRVWVELLGFQGLLLPTPVSLLPLS